jgi:hypothetical protein
MAKHRGAVPPSRSKVPSRASKVASRHTPGNAKVSAGGGARLNKLKRIGVNYGPSSTNKVSPSAADQLGQHLTAPKQAQPLYTGIGLQPDSGNMLAAKTDCRPGGSRTVYKTGYQSLHGPVAQGATGLAAPDIPGTAPSKRGLDDRGRTS